MAQLQLKVGPITATKTFTDVKATTVLDRFFEQTAPKFNYSTNPPVPIVYTNQQRLDFIVEELAKMIVAVARQQLTNTRHGETESALATETITLDL